MLPAIAERNEKFRTASTAEQRVMIAQDVISQINIGKIYPSKGDYVFTNWNLNGQCKVCALGAMAVSVMNGSAENSSISCIDGLSDFFNEPELLEIERAFEVWEGYKFTSLNAEERLVDIMQNIVNNNGKFYNHQLSWSAR